MSIISRKRKHSDDEIIVLQSKYFLNQHIVDSRDINKMEKIYEKTLNMLFDGAKNYTNNNFNSNTNLIECRSCRKAAKILSICLNCNGDLCDLCKLNCAECNSLLCSNCVMLFNCGTIDSPYCDNCKTFIWK